MAAGNRISGIIVGVVVVAAAIGAYLYLSNKHGAPEPVPCCATPTPAPAPAKTAAQSGPQFDVLRVDSSGDTVIAGRADPNAVVTIKDGNTVLGTVTADANGAFAFLPADPLPPGPHQLTL